MVVISYLGVAQLVARYLGVVEAAGSSPVTQTISSVHNGFQLWTLDFFMLSSYFRSLIMYRSRFFCSFLVCCVSVVMPSDIVQQRLFLFQRCDYVFCHRQRFRYIPQSGSKSLYAVFDSCLSLLSHRLQFVL